ncbi:hypothetical protein RIF29_15479 [Crotalaria pallida]|uniref:Uncharacterized protein n=1 Tax=Crotalaria pallida TaxID=3830 RepID=A0AAN9FDL9_CROPI
MRSLASASKTWRAIVSCWNNIVDGERWAVGDGCSINVWKDNWLPHGHRLQDLVQPDFTRPLRPWCHIQQQVDLYLKGKQSLGQKVGRFWEEISIRWIPPPMEWISLNTYGAAKLQSLVAAKGNPRGSPRLLFFFVWSRRRCLPRHPSPPWPTKKLRSVLSSSSLYLLRDRSLSSPSLSSPQRKLSHRHLHGLIARSLPSPVVNRDSLLQIEPKLATSASPPPSSVAAAKLHRRHQSLKHEPGPKLSVWFSVS